MIRTPKPGTDLYAALVAIVRHPDALDSAELAAILWGRPKLAPLPPPTAATWATRAVAVKARENELHRLTLEANARATRLLGRLVDAGLVEVRGAPRIAPWWPERAGKDPAGALVALMGVDDLSDDEEEEEPKPKRRPAKAPPWRAAVEPKRPAPVRKGGSLVTECLSLLAEVEKGPLCAADVLGRDPGGWRKHAWSVLRELGIVLVAERRATAAGEKVAGAC